MAEPLLYLPKSARPSGEWAKRGDAPAPAPLQRPKTSMREAPGRKVGVTAGSYMDDLTAQHKTVWLCWACRSKFNHRAVGYFYEKNLRVTGRCDGCKEHRSDSHLFIHESLLCDHGGKVRHGTVWTPR